MLWHACQVSGSYASMVRAALEAFQPTSQRPWRFAMYADEITPGNVVAPDNLRKIWVLYWALLDLSRESLHREDAWFLLAAKRTSEVKKIEGGISAIFKVCLKLFFTGGANDVSTVGFEIKFTDDGNFRIFLRLDQVVQDDAAHKSVWHCIGASGSRFCICCQNAFAFSVGDVDSDDDEVLSCDLMEVRQLHLATHASVHESLDRLVAYNAAGMHPIEFRRREQALGFRHQPQGVLQDEQLKAHVRPTEQFVHDWMHVMAVGGVIQKTLFLCVTAFAAAGVSWERIRLYVACWEFPKGQHSPASVFSEKRVDAYKRAKKLKCQASEAVGLLPVIALFVQLAILPTARVGLVGACHTLLALANVLDLLQVSPLGAVDPNMMDSAVEGFLSVFKNTFGTAAMTPKFHSMLHFGAELRRFGMLLTCWVQERKHKMVRAFSNDVVNTKSFERTVMGNVIGAHIFELSKPDNFSVAVGLQGGRPAHTALLKMVRETFQEPDIAVNHGLTMRFSSWGVCSKGDAILVRNGASFVAGIVWLCVEAGGIPCILAKLGDVRTHNADAGFAEWQLRNAPEWLEATDVLDTCAFTWVDAHTVRTFLGSRFR